MKYSPPTILTVIETLADLYAELKATYNTLPYDPDTGETTTNFECSLNPDESFYKMEAESDYAFNLMRIIPTSVQTLLEKKEITMSDKFLTDPEYITLLVNTLNTIFTMVNQQLSEKVPDEANTPEDGMAIGRYQFALQCFTLLSQLAFLSGLADLAKLPPTEQPDQT